MYKVKKTVRKGQKVFLKNKVKPFGRIIFLDTASQKQLKHLYEDLHHGFIEKEDKKSGTAGAGK